MKTAKPFKLEDYVKKLSKKQLVSYIDYLKDDIEESRQDVAVYQYWRKCIADSPGPMYLDLYKRKLRCYSGWPKRPTAMFTQYEQYPSQKQVLKAFDDDIASQQQAITRAEKDLKRLLLRSEAKDV